MALSQQTTCGNRCQHNPHKFKTFLPPPQHRARRGLQAFAREKLENFIDNQDKILINLKWANLSQRRQRSERREAIFIVSSILLHYMDIQSYSIGTPTADGHFVGLSLAFIATKAGWRLEDQAIRAITSSSARQRAAHQGIRRVQRALRDLVRAGYLKIQRCCVRRQNNNITGYPSKRRFTTLFFKHLGISRNTLNQSQRIAKTLLHRRHQRQSQRRATGTPTCEHHYRRLLYEGLKQRLPTTLLQKRLQAYLDVLP